MNQQVLIGQKRTRRGTHYFTIIPNLVSYTVYKVYVWGRRAKVVGRQLSLGEARRLVKELRGVRKRVRRAAAPKTHRVIMAPCSPPPFVLVGPC